MKNTLMIGLICIGLFLGVYVLGMMGLGMNIFFQPLNTAVQSSEMSKDIVTQTMTAENALTEYHWFKQQFEDIKALENKLKRAIQDYDDYKSTLPDDKNKWVRQDREELSRLKTISTGIANMYDNAIADYDARSKMTDKSIFKDDLPADIMSGIKTGMQLLGNK